MNIEYDKKMISCDLKCKLVANYGNSTATITNGIMNKQSTESIQGISLGEYTSKKY